MKLEVGMYVRLQNDAENIVIINRIANVFETTILTENDGSIYQGEYTKENVVKASYNIIDILEVGDYVNGIEIIKIYEKGDSFTGNHNYIFKEKTIEVSIDNYETIPFEALFTNKEIEIVVTKEQFEQMAYKVGD